MSEFNQTKGIKRVIKAAGYSKDGFMAGLKEPAIYQLVALHIVLIGLVFLMDFGLSVKMLLIFASFFSLIVEFINTAIEAAVDHTSMEIHPLAKIAKDLGSAAQTLALALVALLWAMAFLG